MSSFDDLTHNLTPFSSTQSLTAVNTQRLIQLLSPTAALGMLLLSTALPASGQVQVLDQVVAIVDDDIILTSEELTETSLPSEFPHHRMKLHVRFTG